MSNYERMKNIFVKEEDYDENYYEDEMPTELEINADKFAQKHYKAPPNYEYYACVCGYIGGVKEYTEKAKEIIKDILNVCCSNCTNPHCVDCKHRKIVLKAEQFLKEIEKITE